MRSAVFETNYENYCRQIAGLDFSALKETLGIELQNQKILVPFLGETFTVSRQGIADETGRRPHYRDCVILSKYLLLCPDAPDSDTEWSALKDFHKISQFTNLNVFTSDAERPIVKNFSNRVDALVAASEKLGGKACEVDLSYDLAMEFIALPKIKILLLFNDCDDEFPATSAILFQRRAQDYLDPESLIMTGISFTQRLINGSKS